MSEPKPPTAHTTRANLAAAAALASDGLDPADTERATRGLIATHPTGIIGNPDAPHGMCPGTTSSGNPSRLRIR